MAEEPRKPKGERTGKALVELMSLSPLRDVDIEPARVRQRVRDVSL
jgi:hypothetical protein